MATAQACLELLGIKSWPVTLAALDAAKRKKLLLLHPDRPGGDTEKVCLFFILRSLLFEQICHAFPTHCSSTEC